MEENEIKTHFLPSGVNQSQKSLVYYYFLLSDFGLEVQKVRPSSLLIPHMIEFADQDKTYIYYYQHHYYIKIKIRLL